MLPFVPLREGNHLSIVPFPQILHGCCSTLFDVLASHPCENGCHDREDAQMGRRLVREFELDAVKLNPDQVLPMPATQLLSELLIRVRVQFLFQVGDPQVFVVWRWRGQAGAHRPDVGDRAQHALRNPSRVAGNGVLA